MALAALTPGRGSRRVCSIRYKRWQRGARSRTMIQLLILVFFAYLALLGTAAYFTRPATQRMMGALAGGVAAGPEPSVAARNRRRARMVAVPVPGRAQRAAADVPRIRCLLCGNRTDRLADRAPFRLARNRMLACRGLRHRPSTRLRDCVALSRVDGVWPGIAPIAGNAAVYFFTVALTLAVMRLIAGPATKDRLARS